MIQQNEAVDPCRKCLAVYLYGEISILQSELFVVYEATPVHDGKHILLSLEGPCIAGDSELDFILSFPGIFQFYPSFYHVFDLVVKIGVILQGNVVFFVLLGSNEERSHAFIRAYKACNSIPVFVKDLSLHLDTSTLRVHKLDSYSVCLALQ